jgi:hypothetical protein
VSSALPVGANAAIACASCAVDALETPLGGSAAMPLPCHSFPTCPIDAADVIALLLMS